MAKKPAPKKGKPRAGLSQIFTHTAKPSPVLYRAGGGMVSQDALERARALGQRLTAPGGGTATPPHVVIGPLDPGGGGTTPTPTGGGGHNAAGRFSPEAIAAWRRGFQNWLNNQSGGFNGVWAGFPMDPKPSGGTGGGGGGGHKPPTTQPPVNQQPPPTNTSGGGNNPGGTVVPPAPTIPFGTIPTGQYALHVPPYFGSPQGYQPKVFGAFKNGGLVTRRTPKKYI